MQATPGTFQAVQSSSMAPVAANAVGRWVYIPPHRNFAGTRSVNGFAPMALTIVIHTQEGGGFRGVGSDGYSYFFKRG